MCEKAIQKKIYNKQSIANSNNIYALTVTGYMKFLNRIDDARIGFKRLYGIEIERLRNCGNKLISSMGI